MIFLFNEAPTWRMLMALRMSPLVMKIRVSKPSVVISRCSWVAIFRMNRLMSSALIGRKRKTAHRDWMGSMIFEE